MIARKDGTPAEQKRASQGWEPPSNRPKCENCINAGCEYTERYPKELESWRCVKGGFSTLKGAWCEHHERGISPNA